MTRRSAFADKLNEFADFVFQDEALRCMRGRWAERFRTRRAVGHVERSRIILEIGCHTGEFIARIAHLNPQLNFIGLDWKARPLYIGAQRVAEQVTPNLALVRARAQNLSSIFADGELDEMWLLHPDPFDDPRERATRLMSGSFLLEVHRLLAGGGRFVLKTDHPEYFRSTRQLLEADSIRPRFRVDQASEDFWAEEKSHRVAFADEMTPFERRFVRRKVPIRYLEISRI